MLLLFFFVHLLSKRSSAAQTLDPRAPGDSCDDNSCRKLFDIVWGCLATIFACTWVSVHPNVPAPDEGWLACVWRRLRMMITTVVASELMVSFAARQFYTAWTFSKAFKVSLTHGFFFSMGGFVSQNGHPITTTGQLEDTIGKQYREVICDVEVEDITTRSKA
ncbi:hypothetical protein DFH09DRAFT_1219109 [Mycena vulgaris]|nr:hypothetical protein DFH09DRAFT_1219109 [Mycena vulgaris]